MILPTWKRTLTLTPTSPYLNSPFPYMKDINSAYHFSLSEKQLWLPFSRPERQLWLPILPNWKAAMNPPFPYQKVNSVHPFP